MFQLLLHLFDVKNQNDYTKTETGSKSLFDSAYFHQKLLTEIILLSNFYTNLSWKDANGRKGAHRRKYFLKTVPDSIGCPLSYMCERSRQKNTETDRKILRQTEKY